MKLQIELTETEYESFISVLTIEDADRKLIEQGRAGDASPYAQRIARARGILDMPWHFISRPPSPPTSHQIAS